MKESDIAAIADGFAPAIGKPDIAIEHAHRAMRLSPLDPNMYQMEFAIGQLTSSPADIRRQPPWRWVPCRSNPISNLGSGWQLRLAPCLDVPMKRAA
jgi:hypothetical protein